MLLRSSATLGQFTSPNMHDMADTVTRSLWESNVHVVALEVTVAKVVRLVG